MPEMRTPSAWIAEGRRGTPGFAPLLALLLALLPWWGRGAADDPAPTADLQARVASLEAEREALRARVEALELELARERDARLTREQEWLDYVRTLGSLVPEPRQLELPTFGPHLPRVDPAEADAAPQLSAAERAGLRRSEEVRAGLRALLAAEGVRGIDLLEVGRVREGGVGPVVFRLLDADGRLAGSLYAERLRLEASLAGRTLTLVLEDGHESHGGQRTPFGRDADPGGPPAWRIPLEGLDPRPWVDSLGELFGETPDDGPPDDGLWDLAYVQVTLNTLLREDAAGGWLRIKRLGGVDNGVLRDVHVEVLDPQGRLERRVFADRLTLESSAEGVVLRFTGGVHLRGEERTPFLDGGWRVWLPRARTQAWRAAGLPGLVTTPSGPAAAGRGER
jgi:hypothetical protein